MYKTKKTKQKPTQLNCIYYYNYYDNYNYILQAATTKN